MSGDSGYDGVFYVLVVEDSGGGIEDAEFMDVSSIPSFVVEGFSWRVVVDDNGYRWLFCLEPRVKDAVLCKFDEVELREKLLSAVGKL